MKKILFVDDEPGVVQGLKRMLRNMRDSWEMFFAGGGEEALNIMKENNIDVLVTDMRMPGMDGAELIEKVSQLYPNIVRIILSGYSDQEMIMKSVKYTHQFLVKPCDATTLKHAIERACLLQDLLKNESLIKVVTGIKTLPSLPKFYHMIVRELQSPYPSIKRIGDIISQDVTMTAKILQFVNSAFFSLPNKISCPRQAATILGLNTLKALILYVQVFTTFSTVPKISISAMESLWKHCMMVGVLAGEISRIERADKSVEDDAFAAGMLHDIGKLLLLEIPGYPASVKGFIKTNKCSELEAENNILGTSHAEVGAYLLGLWGINDSIVEAVAFHHHPSRTAAAKFTPLTAVHVANAHMMEKNSSSGEYDIDLDYLKAINMSDRLEHWLECGNRTKLRSS